MDQRTRAGRQAALLFAIGGGRTLVGVVAGTQADAALLRLALGFGVLAALAWFVPWQRLPRSASALLALPAFALLGVSQDLGLVPPRAMGVPFVIAFAWVGANHRRGTSLLLLPIAALASGLPMAATEAGFDARALLLTMGGCVIVAEVIALAMETAARSTARAEQAARAFGVVARASAGLHRLDPERVLDAVADAVLELGYDGADLAVLDATHDAFRVLHARGVAREYSGISVGGSEGVTGQVRRTGQPVVVEDYRLSADPVEAVVRSGVRRTVAVPVFCGSDVVAVLHATSLQRRAVLEEEVEAMRILAATAGTALENAQEFLAERTSAERHATAALTDPLTGVGNRRHADQLLGALRPGDCLVMIDLDHFKAVNDRAGHAAGDAVLRALAHHLAHGLRDQDRVARFGGEEFLVVLQGVNRVRAAGTVQRLLDTWQRSKPETTFSAGIAHHDGGSVGATLERADRALYAAKAAGRATWRGATASTILAPSDLAVPGGQAPDLVLDDLPRVPGPRHLEAADTPRGLRPA